MRVLDPRLGSAVERMDHPAAEGPDLEASLRHLAQVNRWLGGRRALLQRLPRLLPASGRPLRVLDVAAGDGELARVVLRWGERRGRRLSLVAVELHPHTRRIAAARLGPQTPVVGADALRLPFRDGAFDAGLLTLALHHFEDDEAIVVLRELARVCGGRVLVSDLERCRPNWLGALFLSRTLWRWNPLTRHDGPLSVLRAFVPAELDRLGRAAGLRFERVERVFFFRLLLEAQGAAGSFSLAPRAETTSAPQPAPRSSPSSPARPAPPTAR